MGDFSQTKFSSLTQEQQHKHAMALLKELYLKAISSPLKEKEISLYQEWMKWIEIAPLPCFSPESIADRFHFHLAQIGQNRQENDYLPHPTHNDHTSPIGSSLHLAIVLDHLRSAHNVGSILRTTEAFNLGTLYHRGTTPSRDHPQVKKTSMGASKWTEMVPIPPIHTLPSPLIALETIPEAVSVRDFIFPKVFTLVLGNEEYGCSSELLSQADFFIKIPLYGRKNSLNVANAYAIAAAEISHQLRINL